MAVYYNDEGELKLLAGSTNYQFCPIGSILPFGGTTAPNGFFLCQGQALSRTDYKELFDVIGTSFGVGDGSTTFNLPDLRGEFLRGAGTNSHSGEGSGGNVGTHQGATKVPSIITRQNNIATANHNDPTANNAVENPDYGTILPSANGVGIDYNLQGTVYSSSLNSIKYTTRPTNTSVNYIIKAKVVGDESDDLTIVDTVQNGNMNPVTSNAVFDKLNSIAVGTVTGQASGMANVVRVGRLAVVTFNNVTFTSTRKMNIQQGFRPIGQAFFVPITGAGALPVASLQFDPDGVITQNGTEANLYGTFIYVCEA